MNELMAHDLTVNSSSNSASMMAGNPLWATDNSHTYFAGLMAVNVHLTIAADDGQSDNSIDYDMVSEAQNSDTMQLFFKARHYSVVLV